MVDNTLMAVNLDTDSAVRIGQASPLFNGEAVGTKLSLSRYVERFYDIAPDGESFVVVRGVRQGINEILLATGNLLPAVSGGKSN